MSLYNCYLFSPVATWKETLKYWCPWVRPFTLVDETSWIPLDRFCWKFEELLVTICCRSYCKTLIQQILQELLDFCTSTFLHCRGTYGFTLLVYQVKTYWRAVYTSWVVKWFTNKHKLSQVSYASIIWYKNNPYNLISNW